MKSYALVFPGQGSQEVGMAGALLDLPLSFGAYQEADEALGIGLTKIITDGPDEQLTLTYNAQPAILATSNAIWRLLNAQIARDNPPLCVAGHSLGEYSALVAAGSLVYQDAVKLVRKRGELMQNAVPAGIGTMAALIGGKDEDAKLLVKACAQGEVLDVANFNAPGQVVISGQVEAVKRAMEKAKDFDFKKAVQLNVSAPFHSRLMAPVRVQMAVELSKYHFSEPICPVVHNVIALGNIDPELMPDMLAKQMDSPVRWVESVTDMIYHGVEVFIEVGHGSVLQGLVKKIAGRDWAGEIIGCASPADIPSVIEMISGIE